VTREVQHCTANCPVIPCPFIGDSLPFFILTSRVGRDFVESSFARSSRVTLRSHNIRADSRIFQLWVGGGDFAGHTMRLTFGLGLSLLGTIRAALEVIAPDAFYPGNNVCEIQFLNRTLVILVVKLIISCTCFLLAALCTCIKDIFMIKGKKKIKNVN
jgi:hypothetical protein